MTKRIPLHINEIMTQREDINSILHQENYDCGQHSSNEKKLIFSW